MSIIYERLILCDGEDCLMSSAPAGRELIPSSDIIGRGWLSHDEIKALKSAEYVRLDGVGDVHYCKSCAEKIDK